MDPRQNYMPSVGFFNAFIQQERNPIRILKSKRKNPPISNVFVRPNGNKPQLQQLPSTVSNFGILHPVVIRPITGSVDSTENVWQLSMQQQPNSNDGQPVTNGLQEPNGVVTSDCSNGVPHSKKRKLGIVLNVPSESLPETDEIKSENSSNSLSDEIQFPTDDENSLDSVGSDAQCEENSPKFEDGTNLKISNIVTLTPQELRKIKNSQSNHIKRPLNAFMAYSKVQRRKIMDEHPEMHHAAVSKQLGVIWKAFTPEEKKPYYEEAKKLAEEHLQKYPGYKYKPRPRRAKVEENFKPIPPIPIRPPVSTTTTLGTHNASENSTVRDAPPPGRISPSNFHSWSLIYESEEEEEEVEEEMEDSE